MSLSDKWDFDAELMRRVEEVNALIESHLPITDVTFCEPLHEAIRHGILGGGKRIRALLLRESFRSFSTEDDSICHPMMVAIEMIHAYSLIHDDLPAMDNDSYRRGQPSTWAQYGEAIAILAGDALLNSAYETALDVLLKTDRKLRERGRLAMRVLAKKAGIHGMIGGQAADILAEGGRMESTADLLFFIHGNKTAALFEAAMMIGTILAGGSKDSIAQAAKAAYYIGMAFQITDDILDESGDFNALGKATGSDQKKGKLTAPGLLGEQEARQLLLDYSGEATALIDTFPQRNEFLTALVNSLVGRQK